MRFTISVFSFVLLLTLQACKRDTPATPADQPRATVKPEKGKETSENASEDARIKLLSAEDFDQTMKNNPNVPVIDLRTPEQYAKAHINGAVNIPFVQNGFADKVKHLDGSREVLVYDANGVTSISAVETFKFMKIGRIKVLDKGIYSWAQAQKIHVSSMPTQKKK